MQTHGNVTARAHLSQPQPMEAGAALVRGLVNFYNDAGTLKVRQADVTLNQPAMGFVDAAASVGAIVHPFTSGILDGLSGLTPGPAWLSTAGTFTNTAPTVGILQRVGMILDANRLLYVNGGLHGSDSMLLVFTAITATGVTNHTVSTRTEWIKLTAAGGGSSGGRGGSGNQRHGGASAAVVREFWLKVTPGETIAITIGSGGAALTANGNGLVGGDTIIGSYLTIPGGGVSASTFFTANAFAGLVSGSERAIPGGDGGLATAGAAVYVFSGGTGEVLGGGGAASGLANGGAGFSYSNGLAGQWGSGGGATYTGTQSGAGGDGVAWIEEYGV